MTSLHNLVAESVVQNVGSMPVRSLRRKGMVAILLAGATLLVAGCVPNPCGLVDSGSATQNADGTFEVVLAGDFNTTDTYVVTGPPNGTTYFTGTTSTGTVTFMVDLAPRMYTFVVDDVSSGCRLGEVSVTLSASGTGGTPPPGNGMRRRIFDR